MVLPCGCQWCCGLRAPTQALFERLGAFQNFTGTGSLQGGKFSKTPTAFEENVLNIKIETPYGGLGMPYRDSQAIFKDQHRNAEIIINSINLGSVADSSAQTPMEEGIF